MKWLTGWTCWVMWRRAWGYFTFFSIHFLIRQVRLIMVTSQQIKPWNRINNPETYHPCLLTRWQRGHCRKDLHFIKWGLVNCIEIWGEGGLGLYFTLYLKGNFKWIQIFRIIIEYFSFFKQRFPKQNRKSVTNRKTNVLNRTIRIRTWKSLLRERIGNPE